MWPLTQTCLEPSLRVAAILVSFNMPERTDSIVSYIRSHTTWPLDIIVVDNGSEERFVSNSTTLRLRENVQTCNGWLMGLNYADAMATVRRERYLAYWFIITSAFFPLQETADILSHMATHMLLHNNTVGIHPALTDNSTTQWDHMKVSSSSSSCSCSLVLVFVGY